MRDSMGAAWIFSICLTFIFLFVGYLAITLNYARAFRVKNYVVTYLEEHEGYRNDYEYDLVNYVNSEGHTVTGKCANRIQVAGYEDDWTLESCINQTTTGECSVCIYRKPDHVVNGKGCMLRSSYRVVTFFKLDLPIVKYFSSLQVGGETRYIYDFAQTGGCY